MLYCDIIAKSESDALDRASEKLRLGTEFLQVVESEESGTETRYRIEATKSRGQEAHDVLKKILGGICSGCDLFFVDSYDRILINVTGPHLGLIIGKNGLTLEALETVISVIHNRDYSHYKPIVINPGGYRENKQKYLKSLVRSAVDAAASNGSVSLPPMCRADRNSHFSG
jgi:spoIIIJ-associated protein